MGILKDYEVAVAISLFSSAVAICSLNITCPCGISGESIVFCLDIDPGNDDPCAPWANCATCRSDSKECLSCPEGRSGTTCDQRITSGYHSQRPALPDTPAVPTDVQHGQKVTSPSRRLSSPGNSVPGRGPRNRRVAVNGTGTLTTSDEGSLRSLYEIMEYPDLLVKGQPVKMTKIFELFHKVGIEDILTSRGPTTVFLPSDIAFDALPKGFMEDMEHRPGLLRQVLLYHVTKEEILPNASDTSYAVPSMQGMPLNITMSNLGRRIRVNGAGAVAVTRAANGIFYVIKQLLFPHQDIVAANRSTPDLNRLAELLGLSGGAEPHPGDDEESEEVEYGDDYDPVTYCQSPGLVENGYWTVMSHFNKGRSPPRDDDDEFPERTRIKFFCDDGFSMSGGFPTSYCQHNGFWSSETPFCNMECGYTTLHSLKKVHSGVKTVPGEWPWTVAISKISGIYSRLSCGGSLLDSRTVLTAAHCLMDPDLENTTAVRLYFGKYNRSDWRDDDQVVNRTPSIFMIHPKYDAETKDNDIALIRFDPPIRYSRRIRPVCLPTRRTSEQNLNIGRSGYVMGWGTTERNLVSEQLLMALVPVLPGPECMRSFERQNMSMSITRNMFCAGFPEGRVASCTGDSGGPLVFHDPQTDRHTIEGIVSFGRHRECGMPHRYTVYTKVSRFLRWIQESMAMSGQYEVTPYCERPDPSGNVRWSVVSSGARVESHNSAEEEYPEDTRLEFTCRDGFTMVGSSASECLSSGYWSGDPPVCQVECGNSLPGVQYTWMVQLSAFWYLRDSISMCKGVLINETTVLTVAHCLKHVTEGVATKVRLFFGDLDEEVRTRTVLTKNSGITMKSFNFQKRENDIALVRFSPPIEYSRGIQPVCLPTRRTSEKNLQEHELGFAIDWGENYRKLEMISRTKCFESIEGRNLTKLILEDNLFCAGTKYIPDNKLISGGILVFYDTKTKKLTLEGMASLVESSDYNVFTKVSAYLDWIRGYETGDM